MNNPMPPPTNISAIVALLKLEKHLCPDQIELLASLLADVMGETGYGAVKIIIVDGRIPSRGGIKAEKSY